MAHFAASYGPPIPIRKKVFTYTRLFLAPFSEPRPDLSTSLPLLDINCAVSLLDGYPRLSFGPESTSLSLEYTGLMDRLGLLLTFEIRSETNQGLLISG